MAKCNICGTQLANAPSWLDDVEVFTCPNCKTDDGSVSVTAAYKPEKKAGCPSCGGNNIVDNDINSMRCEDCGVELCKLCDSELIVSDDTKECKGCGNVFPVDLEEEDGSHEPEVEGDYDN